jgi:hypothetical protein
VADRNQHHERPAPQPDALDRELNVALAKYAAVEPRAGLEERVLANLRAEGKKASHGAPWGWSLAAAVAAVVIVVAMAWMADKPLRNVTGNHPLTTTQGPRTPGTWVVTNDAGRRVPPQERPKRNATQHRLSQPAMAANPKLDQFPSPQPLSEQEKILASYVAKYPEHAALLAEARMESLRRDAEERRQLAAEDQDSQQ